jgi:hypothetical protein
VPPTVRGGTIPAWSSQPNLAPPWTLPTYGATSAPPCAEQKGINPKDWTRRELRHSFVSLLSDNGLPIDEIARLVGHSSSAVTELVYRQKIRPVVQSGAVIMDRIFDVNEDS